MSYLSCKVIKKEDEVAVLGINHQTVTVPLSALPSSVETGDFLKIVFLDDAPLTDKKLAKTILEEILNGK